MRGPSVGRGVLEVLKRPDKSLEQALGKDAGVQQLAEQEKGQSCEQAFMLSYLS